MKKILTVFVAALLLTACGNSKEQQDLKQVLTEKFKDDSDLKDYKLKPEDIAECVVANISEEAPPVPGDPKRVRYFEAFTKFASVKSPSDLEKAVKEYQDVFGGIKETYAAANNVTDFIMSCMGMAIEKATPDGKAPPEEKAQPEEMAPPEEKAAPKQ
ncbi:MAG: membrane lipoprotein lipid attachment site-containing protein [Candidatus Methylumidiphilus sp.]